VIDIPKIAVGVFQGTASTKAGLLMPTGLAPQTAPINASDRRRERHELLWLRWILRRDDITEAAKEFLL
jgi:hypothetical protein